MDKKKILILDDEQEICFLLAILLKRMGYESDCAHTLAEAKKLLTGEDYDLAFIDLNLPDGLGYTLAEEIKLLHHDATKVVLISAHDALLSKIKSKNGPIDFFIDKPFNKEKINNALHSIDFV